VGIGGKKGKGILRSQAEKAKKRQFFWRKVNRRQVRLSVRGEAWGGSAKRIIKAGEKLGGKSQN